jgi:preprotein translocase subunit SecD
MSQQWKWKVLGVLGLTILAALMLVPSFMGGGDKSKGEESKLPEWFTKVFSQKIVLGLDLQGGMHLQYKVDIDEALARRTAQLAGNVEAALKTERGVTAHAVPGAKRGEGSVEEMTTLKVKLDDASAIDKIDRDFVRRFVPDYEIGKAEGDTVTLTMRDQAIDDFRKDALDKAIETIERRINEFGVAESSVTKRGDDEIVIELPGVKEEDFAQAKEKLGQTGQLRFQIVADQKDTQEFMSKVAAKQPKADAWPADLPADLQKHKVVNLGYTVRSTSRELLEYMAKDAADDDHIVGYEEVFVDPRSPNLDTIQSLSKDQEDALRRRHDFDPTASVSKGFQLHYLQRKAGMSGEKVVDARVGFDQFNRPEVYMTFDTSDADRFFQMTKEHVHDLMAIMIDDVVYSAPRIDEPIPGGHVRIRLGAVGQSASKEANALVAVLKSGALQAPLRKMYDSQIGPTLGADSIQSGKMALLVAFVLVVGFMAVYYKGAGLVANVALILNVVFMMALLAAFGATLTLPGIGGVALTLGMAVDANVLINERIREELRNGKGVRQSIDLGYEKALSAIVDSNLTTVLAAVVLYEFGSGPIRGFAVTLSIGIICSMFTALVVTRLIFDFLYGRGPAPQKMSI